MAKLDLNPSHVVPEPLALQPSEGDGVVTELKDRLQKQRRRGQKPGYGKELSLG